MEIDTLYSEGEICRVLGLSREGISKLRKKGLPYVKFSPKCRCYFLSDILIFGKQNRIVVTSNKKVGLN